MSSQGGKESNVSQCQIIPLINSGLLPIVHFYAKWYFLMCLFSSCCGQHPSLDAHKQFPYRLAKKPGKHCKWHSDWPCLCPQDLSTTRCQPFCFLFLKSFGHWWNLCEMEPKNDCNKELPDFRYNSCTRKALLLIDSRLYSSISCKIIRAMKCHLCMKEYQGKNPLPWRNVRLCLTSSDNLALAATHSYIPQVYYDSLKPELGAWQGYMEIWWISKSVCWLDTKPSILIYHGP